MKYRKSGLLLSPGIFENLYSVLIEKFEQKYGVSASNLMDYQLFGYGNYDSEQPNLKQLILEETDSSINGKYLYNKYLEWSKGKSPLKFTREFSYVYFNAIGYKDLTDFLKNAYLTEKLITEQKSIELSSKSKLVDEYYIGYNQNEEGDITKSKLTISRYNQTVKWILGYKENGMLIEYIYPGDLKFQENGMSFVFDNSKNELDRSAFVGFYFDRRVKILPYLIGSYAGYDRDRKPVVGVVLFERKNNSIDLQSDFENEDIDERITRFITNKRWSTSGSLPQTLNDLPQRIQSEDILNKGLINIAHDSPFYFRGKYQVFFSEKFNGFAHYNLEIEDTGTVVFEDKTFRYTGHAFISEGAILSIHIRYCNQVPHSAQLLAFVGRYPKDRIAWAKGTWHGLDEKLTPSTRNIILINSTGDIPPDQLIEIESSKKNLGLKD